MWNQSPTVAGLWESAFILNDMGRQYVAKNTPTEEPTIYMSENPFSFSQRVYGTLTWNKWYLVNTWLRHGVTGWASVLSDTIYSLTFILLLKNIIMGLWFEVVQKARKVQRYINYTFFQTCSNPHHWIQKMAFSGWNFNDPIYPEGCNAHHNQNREICIFENRVMKKRDKSKNLISQKG